MAATQVLAVGTGAATSEDVVVTEGSTATFFINDAAEETIGACHIDILIKDPESEYFKIAELRSDQWHGSGVLAGGTYQFRRSADSAACGVVRA